MSKSIIVEGKTSVEAIEKGLKVNVASISRIAKVDRRTAKKYLLAYEKFN